MCLCGMLAAEFVTLPKAMQTALDIFALNERWLAAILEDGRAGVCSSRSGFRAAQYVIGSLEGSMMMALPRRHGAL
jgi:TetR/AcrR family transcriptional repressor of nem operon